MSSLKTCQSCNGFLPSGVRLCPNCGTQIQASGRLAGPLKTVGTVLLGSAIAMTLSACYGAPIQCDDNGCGGEQTCQPGELDQDQDGFCGAYDCNDEDPTVYLWADEIPGDGIDQDCDGND